MSAVYGFTSTGTGYQVFKPTRSFASLTHLVPDEAYIPDVRQPGTKPLGTVVSTATLDSFSRSLSGGYDNVALQLPSPVAADQE